jgi:ABC-type transport system involved in multi-copper enzyme maturation permease subunit
LIALWRAERLRIGKRRDLRVILLVVPILVAGSFALSYISDASRISSLEPGTPQEVIDQFGRFLQRYSYPQSVLFVLSSPWLAVFATAYLGVSVMAGEFEFRTIRNVILASRNRAGYLISRALSLFVVAVVLVAVIAVVGVVVAQVLSMTGQRLPPGPPVDGVGTALLAAAAVGVALELALLGTCLAIVSRRAAVAIVAGGIYLAIESAIAATQAGQLETVSGTLVQLLPMQSAGILFDLAPPAAGAVTMVSAIPVPGRIPITTAAAAVGAWIVAAFLASVWALRESEIPE